MIADICFVIIGTAVLNLFQVVVLPAVGAVNIVPELALTAVIVFGWFMGPYTGMGVGLVCGLAMDIMFAPWIGFYSIPYVLVGFVSALQGGRNRLENFIFPVYKNGFKADCHRFS